MMSIKLMNLLTCIEDDGRQKIDEEELVVEVKKRGGLAPPRSEYERPAGKPLEKTGIN